MGHAKALLAIEDIRLREDALKAAINGASVREIENFKATPTKQMDIPETKDRFYDETAIALKNAMRRSVKINAKKNGKGTITIEFYNKEELSDIAKRLTDREW